MFVPFGLDNARLARWPRVCTAIVVLCVLALAGTALYSGEDEADAAAARALRYLVQHPYLDPPDTMAGWAEVAELGDARPPSSLTAGEVEAQQTELDALAGAFDEAREAMPEYRYSLVPARGLQVGWLTHMFMHADVFHLVGNLLIFVLVVGPFLEDAWGSLFFTAFYLGGGLFAALVQLPRMDPEIPLLGASGAISACLGAFALRFAHRRVRIFYWVFMLWGRFSVPAWLYAFFGFGMDLLALQHTGQGAGVAYAAHVGGFVFGALVALVVRATGLEARLAPEGAVLWRRSLATNRAAEALAAGDVHGARTKLEETLARRPGDEEARLELARIEAGRLDAQRTTELVEPILSRLLSAGDDAGVRALAAEFHASLRPDRLRPATAYRLAELAAREHPALALGLYEAAAAAGGALAGKALLRAAELAERGDPSRARELLARAEQAGVPPALGARARALRARLGPAPAPERPASGTPLSPDEPVRVIPCRLTAIHGAALDLATGEGRAARLEPARVALVAAGLIERMLHAGQARRNGVVLDLLLHARPGEPRLVLRIAGHDLNLAAHRPGVPPATAFAELVEAMLIEGNASASPDPAQAQGRPFARFADLRAYEDACFGRSLTA